MYLPFNYETLNLIDGTYTPSETHLKSKSFAFFERALFQRALSVIKIDGLPSEWTGDVKDLLYFCLFRFGFVPVFERLEYGVTFQPATLYGYDFYYRPTNALISNPALVESLDLRIGTDCEILKLTPDYRGVWDIISYYAGKLALLDSALDMSIINNKYAWLLVAKNKAMAETLKAAVDKIQSGTPAIVLDKTLKEGDTEGEPWEFWEKSGNLKEHYLTTMQLEDFRTILNNFDNEIGIPTIPQEKKERMITDEVNGRNADTISRSKIWIDTLNSSAVRVNEKYGLSIKASRDLFMGGDEVVSENNVDRDV